MFPSLSQEFRQRLKYVDDELKNRAFLCGFSLTAADLLLYVLLRPFMQTWSYQQKVIDINNSNILVKVVFISQKSLFYSETVLFFEKCNKIRKLR